MHIDELSGSLVAHGSNMRRYENSFLETTFRSRLHVSRKRGRGIFLNKGRGKNIEQRKKN